MEGRQFVNIAEVQLKFAITFKNTALLKYNPYVIQFTNLNFII